MKVALIIASPEADQLRSRLEQGLASAGWQIVHTSMPGNPIPELVLALDISLDAFDTACSGAAVDGAAGRAGLAVHIATGQVQDQTPTALPAARPVRECEIRRLALASAPRLRVNAITAPSSGNANASALAGEILAAVMLFVECPAMTGVVIGIDRPID